MRTAKVRHDYCCVCRELADQFATNVRRYSDAVVRLTRIGIPTRDYDQLRAAAIEAKNQAESAEIAFEEHAETHTGDTTERTERKDKAANAG
jgi:hypothetical protein